MALTLAFGLRSLATRSAYARVDSQTIPTGLGRGSYALPVLRRDRPVGKVDATADCKAGVLRVDAIHEDEPFNKTAAAAVGRELKDLARWLEVDLVLPG